MTRTTIHVHPPAHPARELHYRLRYRVCVEELGRAEPAADPQQRRIRDVLDDCATLFAAYWTGRLVGTLRVNTADIADPSERAFYGLDAESPETTVLASRLAVEAGFRRGTATRSLVLAAARWAMARDIRTVLAGAHPCLVAFYGHIGFRVIADRPHPIYGAARVLRLNLDDVAHLAAVRSPLSSVNPAVGAA